MRASRSNLVLAGLLALATLVPLAPASRSQPACDDLGQTSGPDVLIGTDGSDVICGLAGDDQIEALDGTDLVYGGPDDDTIDGGPAGDFLSGGGDENVLSGGAGADVCLGGGGTSCYPKSPRDRNDSRGILDVRKVDMGTGDKWAWRVKTRSRWNLRRLWDDGYVIIYLDTRENQRSDFYLLARSLGRRMSGALFRDGTGRDPRLGGVKVAHPTRNSARFTFDLDRIPVEAGRDFIRWSAQTILINGACAKGCFDRVTNEGALPMPVD
jgi:RTX calcium-binding nonapeptide repeat (4 copies)